MPNRPDIVLLITTLLSATAGAGEPTSPVPIYDEPQHQLLLENPVAQVLDVQIPPGYVSLFHLHENDIFYATMDGSNVLAEKADGTQYRGSRESGFLENVLTYRAEPVVHRVTNEGEGLFRILAIENLSPPDDAQPLERGRVEMLGDPAIENSRFRAYRNVLNSGETIAVHQHRYPSLLLQMSDGNSVVHSGMPNQPTGLNRGAWVWYEAGTSHHYANRGNAAVTMVEIEVRAGNPSTMRSDSSD
jgi:quercetin dioxygenase-like cupin family protein